MVIPCLATFGPHDHRAMMRVEPADGDMGCNSRDPGSMQTLPFHKLLSLVCA